MPPKERGVVISAFSLLFGFAFVWHIWWMVIFGTVGMIASWILYSFQRDKDYYVEISEVEAIESDHLKRVYEARPEYYQQHVATSTKSAKEADALV